MGVAQRQHCVPYRTISTRQSQACSHALGCADPWAVRSSPSLSHGCVRLAVGAAVGQHADDGVSDARRHDFVHHHPASASSAAPPSLGSGAEQETSIRGANSTHGEPQVLTWLRPTTPMRDPNWCDARPHPRRVVRSALPRRVAVALKRGECRLVAPDGCVSFPGHSRAQPLAADCGGPGLDGRGICLRIAPIAYGHPARQYPQWT